MMPLRKFPTPPHEDAARPFFAETVNLLLPAESDVLEPAAGQPSHAESQIGNCTENDERSLNVIENTGCQWGRSGNVIDKTGG
jgi:hypothetical protein